MSKKILFILPSPQCGGAENTIVTLLENLSRKEFTSFVIFIDAHGPLINKIPDDVKIQILNKKRMSRSFFPLIKSIHAVLPDVIMTSICHSNISLLLLKSFMPKKVKKIVIRESNLLTASLNGGGSFLLSKLVRWIYPRADSIICLCRQMVEDLVYNYGIPRKLIKIIPNPVDVKKLSRLSLDKINPYDIEKFNMLSVGSLTAQKGFDILIDSMEILKNVLPDIHLTILGDGPLKNELQFLINQKKLSDHISIEGFKENPYPYFYNADRFILSSRYEGLPNVALEAVALGTPVIAFDSPGCIRDILCKSCNGTLVTKFTAKAMANAILKSYSQNDSHERPSLPEKFKLRSVIDQYQTLFLEN